MHVPVPDHLIITEKTFLSFADSGLLKELEASTKYVPQYKLRQMLMEEVTQKVTKRAEDKKGIEMAQVMKAKGEPLDKIMEYTGLTKQVIKGIQLEALK